MCVPFSGEFVGDGVNNQGGHSGEHDGGGDDGYVGQSVEEEAGGVVLAGGFLLSLVTGGDVGFGAGGVDVDGGGAEGGERSGYVPCGSGCIRRRRRVPIQRPRRGLVCGVRFCR